MAEYEQLDWGSVAPSAGAVRRTADSAIIPFDPGNADYQAYLAWLAAGNTPDLIPAEIPGPEDTVFANDPWFFT